jgi:hypothetical protein
MHSNNMQDEKPGRYAKHEPSDMQDKIPVSQAGMQNMEPSGRAG